MNDHVVLLIGLACVATSLAGCAAQFHAGPSKSLIAEADWPARITAGLEKLAADTPPVLIENRGDLSRAGEVVRDDTPGDYAYRVTHSAAHGGGIVLELESGTPEKAGDLGRTTELAFVSFSTMTRDGQRLEPERIHLPPQLSWSDVRAGVRWLLYEPQVEPCGLIVHLGGNKYVRRALLKHGWAVLSSAGTGRFTQRRASPQLFEIERGERLGETAAQIAAIIDDELADWPYSLEAVLEYLSEHRPDLPQRPAAIMGFSVGALGLPAVVARMPDRFQAAVIVAGGANLLEISQRSHKPDPGIELKWKGVAPTSEDWQSLYAAYVAQVKLDPYHTAAALAQMPVLIYHAHFDQVVPAAAGELLYERLGKPQRFAFPVGHRHLLRIVMRLEAGRLVEWTEAAVFGAASSSKRDSPN